ncbi:piggyBac transposable element-derived protein 4-like [Sipha flava]|jgi:hypothetical protein|uniref:PiggyBac transposable element-derived protein 4 n=1 Tax=Sipha flava TaxID=143950 RepID=A0A2S2QUS6_9HEMI|nr:piggyBac transposable element-derived protein 4-like [Sipha flava]
MSDLPSTSKRPVRAVRLPKPTIRPLTILDIIENDLSDASSNGDFDYSFFLNSSSESDSENEQNEVSADDNDNDNADDNTHTYSQWGTVTGLNQKHFEFNDIRDIRFNFKIKSSCLQYFQIFMTDELVEIMMLETNRNANQFVKQKRITRDTQMTKWVDTTHEEMIRFIGLLFYMGVVKLSSTANYWSRNVLYQNEICRKSMSRERFELLLRFWHFANNQIEPEGDQLCRIQYLITYLVTKFKTAKIPGEIIAVGETMIPFRDRLKFRQFMPQKSHKDGVKLFKVCSPDGYTYDINIFAGKMDKECEGLETVVLNLCEDYLDQGRTIVTDTFYTSIALADSLLERRTHLVGMVKKTEKGLPLEVVNAQIKKREIIGKENINGIVFAKWKERQYIHTLSTCHNLDIVETGKKNQKDGKMIKPKVVVDYNEGQVGIDLSDELSSRGMPVLHGRAIRWYHKVACEILLGTSVVNAYLLWKIHNPDNFITIVEFREALTTELLILNDNPAIVASKHKLEVTKLVRKKNRKLRRRCVHCYEKARSGGCSAEEAKKVATQVSTYCSGCKGNPFVCMECFQTDHI